MLVREPARDFVHFKYHSKKLNSFKVKYLTGDKSLIQKVDNFISKWFDGESYLETNTSGSTGTPKTIRLEKSRMRASAEMTGSYFRFRPGEKILLCLSPDTIGGKMLILRAILHDMELIVADVARNPLENIELEIAFAAMVPLQIQTVIRENPEKLRLIRNLLIGGAAVSPQLENDLKAFEINAYESFGMTETMSHIAVRKLGAEKLPFEALQGITCSLRDEKLVIHAPALGLPELETNDVVELLDAKRFFWKGRADFAVNSGGVKLHPELIEKKLATAIPGRFFIAGEKDALLGEKLVLVLEGNEDIVAAQSTWDVLRERLTGYEVPKQIYFIPAFAETASGKISRLETMRKIQH